MTREKILSVTIKDCRVDTFRAGGKGGQAQNKVSSGVRIVHEPSGAVGESREHRSQLQNKKAAWKRMVDSATFRLWVGRQLLDDEKINKSVETQMKPHNLKIEGKENGKWVDISDES